MGATNINNQAGNGTPGGYKQLARGSTNGTDRAAGLQRYEKQISLALWWARIIASLHAISQFLALCNIIWASVVLLNAFAPSLRLLDFVFIGYLLVLEGIRCASASFFARLPARAVAHLSQDPKRIVHSNDGLSPVAHYARSCSQIVQLILILPSFLISSLQSSTCRSTHTIQISAICRTLSASSTAWSPSAPSLPSLI